MQTSSSKKLTQRKIFILSQLNFFLLFILGRRQWKVDDSMTTKLERVENLPSPKKKSEK